MARHFVITYDDGSEIEETSYSGGCSEEPSFFNSVQSVTETDAYGNKKTHSKSAIFLRGTTTYEGGRFHEDRGGSEYLAFMGCGVLGGALAALVITGCVVYYSGKLVYYIATTEQRRREAERIRLSLIEFYKSDFAEKVDSILTLNNRKLDKYKELYELGILTEKEYNEWVQKYIDESNCEIDKEKKYMEEQVKIWEQKKR